jgi:hypothetical protein
MAVRCASPLPGDPDCQLPMSMRSDSGADRCLRSRLLLFRRGAGGRVCSLASVRALVQTIADESAMRRRANAAISLAWEGSKPPTTVFPLAVERVRFARNHLPLAAIDAMRW